MILDYIPEPQLEFGNSIHFCPRRGINDFYAYDIKIHNRRREILLGVVGKPRTLINSLHG